MALSLGRTIAELDETMSSSELRQWMHYYELEPWGAWRDNYHFARLSSLYASAHSKPGQGPKLADFFYKDKYEEQAEQRQRTNENMLRFVVEGATKQGVMKSQT